MNTSHLRSAFFAGLAACALALPVFAHDYKAGSLSIDHPWARATVAGQRVGGGYLAVKNNGSAPDRLLSATAGISKSVELHTMKMDGDVMRMSEVSAIDLPAGKTIELKPGGLHLMFMGLKAPLKAGDSFPLTLKFEKAGEVKVEVKVEAPKAAEPQHKH